MCRCPATSALPVCRVGLGGGDRSALQLRRRAARSFMSCRPLGDGRVVARPLRLLALRRELGGVHLAIHTASDGISGVAIGLVRSRCGRVPSEGSSVRWRRWLSSSAHLAGRPGIDRRPAIRQALDCARHCPLAGSVAAKTPISSLRDSGPCRHLCDSAGCFAVPPLEAAVLEHLAHHGAPTRGWPRWAASSRRRRRQELSQLSSEGTGF